MKNVIWAVIFAPMALAAAQAPCGPDHIRSFARQIFKWAKAKVAIIRKHGFDGLLSHVYLWPAYLLICLIFGFLFFYFLNIFNVFLYLVLLAFIFYISAIGFEAFSLSKKYDDNRLLFYVFLLLPILHISYSLGVFNAIFRKRIW